MASILCTGGAGFIGSHVATYLRDEGHDVVVVDDLSGGSVENVPKGVTSLTGVCCSLYDHYSLEYVFNKFNFDYVFHIAAYAAEGLSHFIRRYNYSNNLICSTNVINMCVKYKVKCLVFTSSIAVYGHGGHHMIRHQKMVGGHMITDWEGRLHKAFTERDTPKPVDPYGIAKYAVELDLAAARDMFGLNYIIFRPHNVYGPRQNIMDKYRNVIGIFMRQILANEPITIFGDGGQSRAFTYIDDVAPVIARSIRVHDMYNEIYNVGSTEVSSVGALAHMVRNVMEVPDHPIVNLPARNEVVHAVCEHTKLYEALLKTPYPISKTPLDMGIKKMAEWVNTVKLEPTKDFTHIEVLNNLPESWRK